jgi:hypothetical protein
MRSSSPISLFSGPPQRESGPSAFLVSMVLHGIIFGILLISVRHVTVVQRMPNRRYMVRLLDVRESEATMRYFPRPSPMKPSNSAPRHALTAGGKNGIARFSRAQQIARNFVTPKPAPQTMIQPEVPPDQMIMPQIPQAMVWTAGHITLPKIVPPVQQRPGAIPAKPSLEQPNQELTIAEIPLSSTPFVTHAPLPVPGSTSPVKVNGPTPATQLPQTASRDAAQASAARVISMSQQKLQQGTAALPVVNEIAEAAEGSPTPGDPAYSVYNGNDDSDSRVNGTGSGRGAGDSGENADGVVISDGSGGDSGSGEGFTVATGEGYAEGGGGDPPAHIVLPKGGHYGMVVVGASPQESYLQTAHLWAGRLVYSVYLQTETNRNWILQFSLPTSAGDDPDPSRPEPPWPYDMTRPNLGYKDVVLVHGFVSSEGRFEQLSVAYPPQFSKTGLLLSALKKWEFRPAMNQGQPTAVEVLLIIPASDTD